MKINIKRKALIALVFIFLYFAVPYTATMISTGVVPVNVSDEVISGRRVVVEYKNAQKCVEVNKFIIMVLAKMYEDGKEAEYWKALAVMLRTDIFRTMGDNLSIKSSELGMEFMTKSDMKREWGSSFDARYNLLADCVASVNPYVIKFKDNLIEAEFTGISSGKTLDGAKLLGENYGYLKSVECPKDLESANFVSVNTFSYADFIKKIKKEYSEAGLSEDTLMQDIQMVSKTEEGYVLKMQVGNVILSGEKFAGIMGLQSNCMQMEDVDGKIRITTKGKGSGFGVSLYSAALMAKEGKSFEDILKNFYHGIAIVAGE